MVADIANLGLLQEHLQRAVPEGGHGYGEDDLAHSAEKFHSDLAALHADDHQTGARWAASIQSTHTHEEQA